MKLTHGSTFSGIGGPELAAEMLGWENAFHCEINPFGRRILDYYYPNAKSYEDITKTDFTEWRGKIDILTGGFPCQPFSLAGRRRGEEDDRYLWTYMLRCIDQIRPTWFVGENVAGILTMVLSGKTTQVGGSPSLFDEGDNISRTEQRFVVEEICQNLESIGYSVQPMLVPACAVGAPHRRDRVFFIAHNERDAIADSNLRDDRAESRNDGGTQREKRIQERNDLRKSRGSSGVRPEGDGTAQDTLHMGCQDWHSVMGQAAEPRNIGTTSGDGQTERPIADSDGHRGGASEPSGRTQGCWCDGLSVESERSAETQRTDGLHTVPRHDADTDCIGWDAWEFLYGCAAQPCQTPCREEQPCGADCPLDRWGGAICKERRWRAFPTQSPVCRGDDGIPFDVDCLAIPWVKGDRKRQLNYWRAESLKAFGNAIVPQVMYEIFKAIDKTYES